MNRTLGKNLLYKAGYSRYKKIMYVEMEGIKDGRNNYNNTFY